MLETLNIMTIMSHWVYFNLSIELTRKKGPYLATKHLLSKLQQSRKPIVANISSESGTITRG